MVQQSRKQEQQQEKYQLERELLFAALFYQNQIMTYLGTYQPGEQLLAFVHLLAEADKESLLAQALHGQLEEAHIQKISELTLWRDQQLEPLNEQEKKYQVILQTLLPYLQKILPFMLKNPNISSDLKAAILEARKHVCA